MSRASIRRVVLAGVCGLLWLAGLAVTLIWFQMSRSAVPPSGSIELSGLTSSVRVHADSFGIPHIFASNEADALRALGYLHATDRLWQMELFRRIAAGRLAELFGEPGLATDRFVRTLGTWRAAERAAETLSPPERLRVEAYVEGVNARLSERPALPPEFWLLRLKPEPWSIESTLAVGMVMNLDLAVWRAELSRFRASQLLDSARFALLLDGYPEWGPTILDGAWSPPPGALSSPPSSGSPSQAPVSRASEAPASRFPDHTAVYGSTDGGADRVGSDRWSPFRVLGSISARSGSNAWVVSGDRTASGHPILANDMHLALRAPSLWYLAALHGEADALHVVGFTLPGVPGVVVGHNRYVAWGFTNGMVDDTDYVIERLSDDGLRYREPGDAGDGWRELNVRIDTIRVRGRDAPELMRIRSTSRGPLISDVLSGLGADLSVLWVAATLETSTTGVQALNRADGAAAMDRAVSAFARPHQNVVYAARDGTIGYRLGGRIPLRGGRDGAVPTPSDSVADGWPGFWPSDAHPAARDPRRGYVATANNLQARGFGRSISSDYAPPFRALRITQALEVRRDWTLESTYRLQHDTRSLLADRVIDRSVAAARRLGLTDQAELLSGWDRVVSEDARAAPLFYSWFYRLRTLIAADEYASAPEWALFPIEAVLRTLEEGSAWIDDVSTPRVENLVELEERAMRDAVRVTDGKSWGELHEERHAHPLGSVDWLERALGLNVGPYASEGGPDTLRPDDYRIWTTLDASSWTPPWISEYGPSERFVAEISPRGIRAGFLIPTGQSGNPMSPHYRDLNARWRSGALVDLPLDEDAAFLRSERTVTFEP
ncbi:MAG: penicillin acylase family protein [marine benthic group bacterium]|nr:penicillin acylase family protein [Gemmatimonadota bacterium]